jgi:hypothetical protein
MESRMKNEYLSILHYEHNVFTILLSYFQSSFMVRLLTLKSGLFKKNAFSLSVFILKHQLTRINKRASIKTYVSRTRIR